MKEDSNTILKELYDDFYAKSFKLMKKHEPLYANSDSDFALFLKFLNDHDMKNYASFLLDLEKDRLLFNDYEKESFETYSKYFQPTESEYLHLKDDFQKEEEFGTRNLGFIIIIIILLK